MIPILMQQKYQPQGWLGISLGTKIYYNLATYSIEEKYPGMLSEIRAYYFSNENENKNENVTGSKVENKENSECITSIYVKVK